MRPSQFLLLLLLTVTANLAHANELVAAAPLNEVSIRNIPAMTVIETEATGSIDTAWAKGFRVGARYAALARSALNTPGILTFPDWDKKPSIEGEKVHVFVQILLDPLPDLPKVPEPGSAIRQVPGTSVACYAMQGAYTPENFAAALKKIEDYLKDRGIPATGSPRYLLYSTTDWQPSWWRVGEVQVPVAVGGRN